MNYPEEFRLKWEDFPRDEYEARTLKAQGLMRDLGLDVMVLTSVENVEYFSGLQVLQNRDWVTKTFPGSALVIHQSKDPVMLIPEFLKGTAFSTSWIENLALFSDPHANPRQFSKLLVDTVRKLGGKSPTVGIESGTHLAPSWNLDDYAYFRAQLEDCDVRSAADVIWGTRMIKSPRELDRIRWLTKITDSALNTVLDNLAVGQTEIELGNTLAVEMMNLGAQGTSFRNIRAGADRYHCSDSLPQNRPIDTGDVLIIDTGAMYNSYGTDVAYTAHIGTATARHHQVYDVVVRAQDAAIEKCRPGVEAREVFLAAARIIEESGLDGLDMIGHGIGMDLHEPVMLTPHNRELLQTGMVLSVEPWLYETSGIGVFALEEHIVVTDDVPEVISTVERNTLREVV